MKYLLLIICLIPTLSYSIELGDLKYTSPRIMVFWYTSDNPKHDYIIDFSLAQIEYEYSVFENKTGVEYYATFKYRF